MPPTLSTKSAALKRQQITLAQLSSYDDILTDSLVDHVSGEFSSSGERALCAAAEN